jgi:8-oxo-dGTP pyrophosphatase MutT (NUDIX family)
MSATKSAWLRGRASARATAELQPQGRFIRLSGLRKIRACEQVAAVCYRIRSGQIEFLLVRTRGGKRWTFPKGSTGRGLTHAQAAALEAFEEAGVHGRIEEVAFAHYRRLTCDDSSSGGDGSVNAHLCEVLRLGTPRESGRDRTWFSANDTRKRLCEGRTPKQASEFMRVVGRAVDRIERLLGAHPDNRTLADGRVRATGTHGRDALQQVKFDFSEVCGSAQNASFSTERRQTERTSSLPSQVRQRENLACEILEFDTPGRLKLPN